MPGRCMFEGGSMCLEVTWPELSVGSMLGLYGAVCFGVPRQCTKLSRELVNIQWVFSGC